ncbi:class I adenylate-forming enzyme family protein [Streptomyces bambusae]|uniref:AMP-binding protein n=1 Tax=Streptomyces bambusae TaxID=1550616 RepID=A0ABS6YY40_9ACTN|nr:class I adenylate-forming enzyme family protein [Streptomyces bambusae]MBW5480400.1 AMP-binding protein [Streptomyces bambusae]
MDQRNWVPPHRGAAPALRILDAREPGRGQDAGAGALATAQLLGARGVGTGTRVLVKAENSPLQVVAFLGLVHLGASVVLVDPGQTEQETVKSAMAARVRFAVVDDRAALPPGCPGITTAALAEAQAEARQPGSREPGRFGFDRWRAQPDALVLWSSGTTGASKGIVKSGRAVIGNLERTRLLMPYREDDVFLPLLPFSHQYGISLVLLAALGGGSLVVAPYARLDRALEAGARCGATVVDATPATYRSVVNLMRRRPGLRAGLGGVRMWCTGGAPFDPRLQADFTETTGRPLLDGYGSTEAGNLAYATPDNPSGCGRVLPGLEVRIVDRSGRPLPAGEAGEVRISSPDLMEGYLTADGSMTPRPSATDHPTGDVGRFDQAGNLHVLGRNAAVHRLGHTLYPDVLERKAESLCGRPVRVVPLVHERRGHALVFVVEDPDAGDPRLWRRRLCEALPGYEHPNHVLVTDRFPVTPRGKTDARRLREWAVRRLAHATGPGVPVTPAAPAQD